MFYLDLDKSLLRVYMEGWKSMDHNDNKYDGSILTVAYRLGKLDYIIGDEVKSNDEQTEEEILENIWYKINENER